MIEKLGVDVGGVIIDRVNDKTDTSFFGDNYLRTTAVPGAFEALARLNAGRFEGRIYLVSKCGPRIEARTRAWLAHHGFHATTGIPAAHLRFCRRRPDKGPICAALGISHFVDDRLEVLTYLTGVQQRYLFHPLESELARHASAGVDITRVETWAQLLDHLL